MAIFDDKPFLPEPSGNQPPDKRNFSERDLDKGNFFTLLRMTPVSLDLIHALKDAAAAYEVSIRAVSDKVPGAVTSVLERYGDLTRAEGALVAYMAQLMDLAKHPELEKRRTKQVRYE